MRRRRVDHVGISRGLRGSAENGVARKWSSPSFSRSSSSSLLPSSLMSFPRTRPRRALPRSPWSCRARAEQPPARCRRRFQHAAVASPHAVADTRLSQTCSGCPCPRRPRCPPHSLAAALRALHPAPSHHPTPLPTPWPYSKPELRHISGRLSCMPTVLLLTAARVLIVPSCFAGGLAVRAAVDDVGGGGRRLGGSELRQRAGAAAAGGSSSRSGRC